MQLRLSFYPLEFIIGHRSKIQKLMVMKILDLKRKTFILDENQYFEVSVNQKFSKFIFKAQPILFYRLECNKINLSYCVFLHSQTNKSSSLAIPNDVESICSKEFSKIPFLWSFHSSANVYFLNFARLLVLWRISNFYSL